MRNKYKFKKVGLAVTFTLVALIGSYYLISAFITRGLAPTIEHQLLALQTEDTVAAYADTSKSFQNVTTLDKFKEFVRSHSVLSNNDSVKIVSKKVEGDVGYVKALITARSGVSMPAKYRLIKEHGSWKITSMVLYPNESSTNPVSTAGTATATQITLPNQYQNERFSFAINYPTGWEYTQPNAKSVLFSTNQSAANISVKPLLHQNEDGSFRTVNGLFSTVTKKLKTQSKNVNVLERGKVIINPSRGERLNGRYAILSYTQNGIAYKQLEVVFYQTEDRALYAIEYNAPANQFNDHLPVAKAMTQSFIFE